MRSPVRLSRFLPGVALILAGLVVLAISGDAITGNAIALGLMGVGGVLAVAAAFWEIGASEDRDRRSGRA
ncbi:MAG: hypothetical protein QOC64_579 [Solirubrobacteraceae bacterium]|jgi:uncharacterized membrane protein HdeD (DUF308 family)|nr:hypothetical protein [Solirubrobacteraceae bacterium]